MTAESRQSGLAALDLYALDSIYTAVGQREIA